MSKSLLPLSNQSILVTRANKQADKLIKKLEGFGAKCVHIPLIEFTPISMSPELDEAIAKLQNYHWLVFVSANAVEFFMEYLLKSGYSKENLNNLSIAAIGPATAKKCSEYGLVVSLMPDNFIAEGLLESFPGYPNLKEKHFLWPRTNIGRRFLIEKLQEAGAVVDEVTVYKTTIPANYKELSIQLKELLCNKSINTIFLASSQTAKHLKQFLDIALNGAENTLLNEIDIVSIGPETSKAIKSITDKTIIEAKEYTIDGMIAALIEHKKVEGEIQ